MCGYADHPSRALKYSGAIPIAPPCTRAITFPGGTVPHGQRRALVGDAEDSSQPATSGFPTSLHHQSHHLRRTTACTNCRRCTLHVACACGAGPHEQLHDAFFLCSGDRRVQQPPRGVEVARMGNGSRIMYSLRLVTCSFTQVRLCVFLCPQEGHRKKTQLHNACTASHITWGQTTEAVTRWVARMASDRGTTEPYKTLNCLVAKRGLLGRVTCKQWNGWGQLLYTHMSHRVLHPCRPIRYAHQGGGGCGGC